MQVQKPALIQRQEMRMSPQLLQSIQILALPMLDLKARIQQEIDENPALEVLEDRSTVSLDEPQVPVNHDSYGDRTESFDSSLNFEGYDDEAGDNKHRFLEQIVARPESLQDHLIWQLRLQPISEEHFQIGEILIRNLDAHGFHRVEPEALFAEELHAVMLRIMQTIRAFEPAGTCTKDYRESLKVQSAQFSYVPEGVEAIVESHLQLLEKGKYKEIAKLLHIDSEDVEEALHFIQQLNPFPGSSYSSFNPQYVIPDLHITRRDDDIVIILNDEEIPVLGIDPLFNDLLHAAPAGHEGKEVKSFVGGKIKDARWFINSIKVRSETLLKVAAALVEFQKEFFLHGPKYIVPLTLRDIAGEIGVHETTVSRLTNGKYSQTDWGLYELKYFFSSAIQGTAGSTFSKEGVKQVLKELIHEENNGSVSDQRLSELLEKKGIKVARRTVSKYRKELAIDSSYQR